MRRLLLAIRRALPWVVSLGLVAYLLMTTDLPGVWEAICRVDVLAVAGVVVVGVGFSYLYDTFVLTLVLRRFNAPVAFREMLPLKGASYLLNIVNYNAAAGGMALYLRRTRGVSFLEAASSFLFLNVADLLALCVLVAAGLVWAGDLVGAETRAGLLATVAVVGAAIVGTWVYWNAGFDFLVLGRLREWRIFRAFRLARVVDYAWLTALRVGIVLVYVLIMWAFLWLFDIRVPFVAMLAIHPIIILLWTVPVSVAGLGTVQVAMRLLFGPFVAPELGDPTPIVDACSTLDIFATVLMRVVIGYACLRRVSREWEAAGGARAVDAAAGPSQ